MLRLRDKLLLRERLASPVPGFREAAVLVPLVIGAGETSLLLTVRHGDLPTHAGQIAFPGGKRDPEDTDLIDTALRETWEEVGLSGICVLGQLDDVPTPAGFVITPVIGFVRGPVALTPNEREVTEVFFAPLSALPQVYRAGPERMFLGRRYVLKEYLYERWRIWGATAAIIYQLLSLLSV